MKENLLLLWISWLRDLGGDFKVIHNLDEPKPPTGRRAFKPNRYPLDPERYGVRTNGSVVRLEYGV